MCIPSHELAELVTMTRAGATPLEAARLETVVDTIKKANITARLDSPQSRFLRNLVDKHTHFLQPGAAALFQDIDLYGTDLAVADAIPRIKDGRRQVIVFEGLCQLIHFYADLITVFDLLQTQRSDCVVLVDDAEQPEALAFSLASFALIADFIETGRTLNPISRLLGRRSRRNAAIGYLGAVLFVLLHEAGHLHLGHTEQAPGNSERPPVSPALAEDITPYQQREFDADRFAYMSLREGIRQDFISSILFFLGPFAFLEAFALPAGRSHPLSVNRGAHLASLMAPDDETAAKTLRIIASQIEGIQSLAARRSEHHGNIRYRIHETMPVELAHQIIREISARIEAEGRGLDVQEVG